MDNPLTREYIRLKSLANELTRRAVKSIKEDGGSMQTRQIAITTLSYAETLTTMAESLFWLLSLGEREYCYDKIKSWEPENRA